jgi:hypothetical protein
MTRRKARRQRGTAEIKRSMRQQAKAELGLVQRAYIAYSCLALQIRTAREEF